MNATSVVAPDVAAADVDDLLHAVFDGRPTTTRQGLADGCGICIDGVKAAIARGDLTAVRVSPRRLALTRAAVRRWLLSLQDEPSA